ncbi:MAG: efflux RND transporter periplasmic adaptor subunit, partial [Flavobacteriaceae bacterium]|nr:efflux RND transporter periplasmic adaptor subunit [Flavobacteriaceae bacterium]
MNNSSQKNSSISSLKPYLILVLILVFFTACNKNNNKADAYGNFEATETTVSAETTGKIISLQIEEGQKLAKGDVVAQIDTIALVLKRNNLLAAKSVIFSKSKGVLSQINVLKAQKETAMLNKKRIEDLLSDKLASQKQLDDINGQITAYDRQMSSIQTQNSGVLDETKTLEAQIQELNHQINLSKVINPVSGTVLVKYAEANEMTAYGRPLYKIANLDVMQFKGYISETQLSSIKVGQKVEVSVDAADALIAHEGVITW